MGFEPEPEEYGGIGEDASTDMGPAFARYANKIVKKLPDSIVVDLGTEVGELQGNRIRFRDACEKDFISAKKQPAPKL